MQFLSPTGLPPSSSFDPAIHLHSQQDEPEPSPHNTFSDDLEAFHAVREEKRLRDNSRGVVIQHRQWSTTADAFLGDEEARLIDTPTKVSDRSIDSSPLAHIFSSSPRTTTTTTTAAADDDDDTMPLISSPVTYPVSSSPRGPALTSPTPTRKRKVEPRRSPLHDIAAPNRAVRPAGGFDVDDSEDEGDVRPAKIARYIPPASSPPLAEVDAVSQPSAAVVEPPPPPPDVHPGVEVPATSRAGRKLVSMVTSSGKRSFVSQRRAAGAQSFERLIAARSTAEPGMAQKSYYGVDIHQLMDDAAREAKDAQARRELTAQAEAAEQQPSATETKSGSQGKTLLWTEKYRANRFIDLVGDERTHRGVLRWLKSWDPIVFPGSSRRGPKLSKKPDRPDEENPRKILLLTGPPGLGKTTLAHVCARQAGYEVQEINASDERSREVVRTRIKDMVGTENVRGISYSGASGAKVRKAGRPVCVVVDEVDGVVSGNSGAGGEGGFIKALLDLVHLDQRNAGGAAGKKGGKFRMLRPMILICNDVYHPSLRPLRQSAVSEIVHVRKPAIGMVVARMHDIFKREGVECEMDGVRRLCEATWGISNRKEAFQSSSPNEGDIRGVMVLGEFVARKLRGLEARGHEARLTRRWVEDHLLNDLAPGGGASRTLGRGGARDIVDRLFVDGAGFPSAAPSATPLASVDAAIGVAEASRKQSIDRLREMMDTCGEYDKVLSDVFSLYPSVPYQDDNFLSKPVSSHEWLHFHDVLSAQVHGSQEWELYPYLSTSALAFHNLFASCKPSARQINSTSANPKDFSSNAAADKDKEDEESPYTGTAAPFSAHEDLKSNRAALDTLRASFPIPLARLFRSTAALATELLPPLLRMLNPDVRPVAINTSISSPAATGPRAANNVSSATVRKASEKALVARAVNAMLATNVRFERVRVEDSSSVAAQRGAAAAAGGWVLRMEPPLDALGRFECMRKSAAAGAGGAVEDKARYAVRQVLEAEAGREVRARREAEVRALRGGVAPAAAGTKPGSGGAGVRNVAVKTPDDDDAVVAEVNGENRAAVKRDFFGRVVKVEGSGSGGGVGVVVRGGASEGKGADKAKAKAKVWVSFNEGYSRAVRKPLSLGELMGGF